MDFNKIKVKYKTSVGIFIIKNNGNYNKKMIYKPLFFEKYECTQRELLMQYHFIIL